MRSVSYRSKVTIGLDNRYKCRNRDVSCLEKTQSVMRGYEIKTAAGFVHQVIVEYKQTLRSDKLSAEDRYLHCSCLEQR